jgi:hypothetical protein
MKRLTQICASYNDLFGLDEDGEVYQYNFNTNAWAKLAHGAGDERREPERPLGHASAIPRQAADRRGR